MRLARSFQWARQGDGLGIALERQPLHRRPAGIAQHQQLGGLVESLAQRVVNGGGKAAIAPHAFNGEDLAMPARDQQQQIGKAEGFIRQPRRERVAFEVIDRQQRLACRHRQRLGAHQSDNHPADQPRPCGGGNRVDIGKAKARLAHHPFDHRRQALGMGARGDFGHHPAIGRMFGFLAGDRLGNDRPVAAHQRHGGLVATRFDTEYDCCIRGVRDRSHPASI